MNSQHRTSRTECELRASRGKVEDLRGAGTDGTSAAGAGPARAGVAVLLALAAAALAWLVRAPDLESGEKTAVILGAAAAALAYGLFTGAGPNRLTQSALAIGLAALYFGLYAAASLPGIAVLPPTVPRLPLLLGALVFCVGVAHWRRSGIAAAATLAMVYATASIGAAESSPAGLTYALCAGAVCAGAALLLHARHRWVSVTAIACIGTYALHGVFFRSRPAYLELSVERHLWASMVFLTLVFLAIAGACIADQRPGHPRRPAVTALATINCVLYFLLAHSAVGGYAPRRTWAFDIGFAVVLGLLAMAAALLARRRSRLAEVFLATALVVLAVAAFSVLSDAALWLTLASANLALAGLFARTRIVFFKVANLVLLIILFAACLWAIHGQGILRVGEYTVGSDRLVGAGIPLILVLVAWVYTHFTKPRVSGPIHSPWFLEGSLVDLRASHMALLHAVAAALLLMSMSIFHAGDHGALPYLLAGEGMGMLAAGFVLFAAPVRMAAVTLLAAAHVTFHFFKVQGRLDDTHPAWIVALAAATLAAGLAWERDTKRAAGIDPKRYDVLGAVIYLPGVAVWAQSMHLRVEGMYGPLGTHAAALMLLAISVALPYAGLRSAAMAAFACGTLDYALRLVEEPTFGVEAPRFLILLMPFLFTYVAGERILAWVDRGGTADSAEKAYRTLLATTAAAGVAAGVYGAFPAAHLPLGLAALAGLLLLLSMAAREGRYLWPGLAILGLAGYRGAVQGAVPPGVAGWGAVLAVPVSVAVAGVAWRRLRRSRARAVAALVSPAPVGEEQAADGRTA